MKARSATRFTGRAAVSIRHGFLWVALGLALTACVSTTNTATTPDDNTRRARIRNELAVGYMERGDYELALTELRKATDADPRNATAYLLTGLIYSQMDEKAPAETAFRRAVALSPRDGDALHNLGWLLCTSGRYAEGRTHLEAALKNPMYANRARTEAARGVCEMKAGNTVEAERLLIYALDSDPQNAIASAALAEMYFDQGSLRMASRYASQANVRGAATPASLWLAMRIERRLNNHEGVSRYARQLRDTFPNARENRLYERGAWNN